MLRLCTALPLAWLFVLTGCSQILGLDQNYGSQTDSDDSGASLPPGNGPGHAVGGGGDDAGTKTDTGAPPHTTSDSGTTDTTPPTHDAQAQVDTGQPPATAAILQVHAGTTTVGAGASTQTAAWNGTDPSHAFVVAGSLLTSTVSEATETTAQIADANNVVFTRTVASGTPAIPIQYYVAEFSSGVQVMRGSATMSANTVNVRLPTQIDLASSFPIITYRNTGATYGRDDFVRAELTNASQLTLSIDLAAPAGIVEWQVVSFAGASVQSGTVTFGANQTSITTTPGNAVVQGSTWLLLSNEVSNPTGTTAELLVSGKVSASDKLTFHRAGPGGTNTVTWYAVSFGNGTTVQSSTLTVGDTAVSGSASLAPIDPLKSIAVAGGIYLRGGTTNYAGGSSPSPGYGIYALGIGTGNLLQATRGESGTSTQSDLDFSVIEFN